jgi:GT2 family glycosyltransferase
MSVSLPSLSIIIVNYNTQDHLRRCLSSLQEHPAHSETEVIVVDNGSSDGSADMVAREHPSVHLLCSPTNEGYGRALNRGALEAHGDVLMFLNPDIEIAGESLDALLAFVVTHPTVGVVGPRLLLSDGQPQPSARRFLSPALLLVEALRLHLLLPGPLRSRWFLGTYFAQDMERRVPWVSGACHVVPRGVWRQVGPLTEETFCGFDDYDYCYRVSRAGYEVWLCAGATMTHHCSVAVRQRWTSWEVEQVAIHNTYVVLSPLWPRWRIKALELAELMSWGIELARHAVWPRSEVAHLDEPYSERLWKRIRLTWRLLSGREEPRRRFQPAGSSSQPGG